MVNSDTIPPLLTDKRRWRRLIIDKWDQNVVQMMDDKFAGFDRKYDAIAPKMTMTNEKDTSLNVCFAYTKADPNRLVLHGKQRSDSLHIALHRMPDSLMVLTSRGFHWVSELPFNR